MPSRDSRVFIFGVGARKAATTWLFKYIKSQHPGYVGFVGRKKQLQVWDRVFVPQARRYLLGFSKSPNAIRRICRVLWRHSWWELLLWNFRVRPASYFLLLRWRLRNKGRVTSDLTPAYCALSKEQFIKIRREVTKHGIEMKVVFLMRDPVERCISDYKRSIHLFGAAGVRKFCVYEGTRLRTRYQDTVMNLEAAFRKDELFFGIYENLFEERSIVALSDFLGMPPNPALGRKRVNAGRTGVYFDDDTRRFIAETYKDTYAFCARRFPVTRELWGGFQWLDGALPEEAG